MFYAQSTSKDISELNIFSHERYKRKEKMEAKYIKGDWFPIWTQRDASGQGKELKPI